MWKLLVDINIFEISSILFHYVICQSDTEGQNFNTKMILYSAKVYYFISIFYNCILASSSEYSDRMENMEDNYSRKFQFRSVNHPPHNPSMDKHKKAKPTRFEIRAALVKCSHYECQLHPAISQTPTLKYPHFVRTNDQTNAQSDSINQSHRIKKCNKKMLITAHMHNEGILDCKNQYVVIDHVYDPVTDCKYRLFNPYILKMKQQPVMQSYSMIFEHVVNSKAKEVVHNKNQPGYKGCNPRRKKPPCKPIVHKGHEIPYSGGFCCSCNVEKKFPQHDLNENSKLLSDVAILSSDEPPKVTEPRKKADISGLNIEKLVSESTREALMRPLNFPFSGVDDQQDFREMDTVSEITEETPRPLSITPSIVYKDGATSETFRETLLMALNSSLRIPIDKNFFAPENNPQAITIPQKFTSQTPTNSYRTTEQCSTRSLNGGKNAAKHPKRRSARSRGFHPRGGQDCKDTHTPPNADPDTYHASTHCLKFSDVWYSVYRLNKPSLRHSLRIEVFEKFEDYNGDIRWHEVTHGSRVKVGTEKLHFQNNGPTLSVTYTPKTDVHNFVPSLDVDSERLLIPDTVKTNNIMKFPQLTGGPPEYLVVPKRLISSDGKQCNKAGVGFEAFSKQPSRCYSPKGSCLENQPSDFWNHDHKAEKEGKKGIYFLKFHGSLPNNPIKEKCEDHSQMLSLYYECDYTNILEFEFRADHNTVLKPHASAIITEVYVDGTQHNMVDIKVKVLNSGLVAGIFYISLANCPLDMPASFNNIASKPALIPPQLLHSFNLNIHCGLPETPFHCTIHVLNTRQEIIAARKIRLEHLDRCVCMWYCRCSCLIADGGMKCFPLTLETFAAAGFQGSLPVSIQLVEYTLIDDVLSIMLYLFLFLCSTLLIMGLTKALIGWCCCLPVGHWGFDVLLNLPKKMSYYHEPDLRGRPVEYSPSGWPIHPDTKEKVRNVPPATEFCLNLIFFFIYPIMLLTTMFRRLCGTPFSEEGCRKDLEEEYCTCPCGKEDDEEEEDEDDICPCCKCN